MKIKSLVASVALICAAGYANALTPTLVSGGQSFSDTFAAPTYTFSFNVLTGGTLSAIFEEKTASITILSGLLDGSATGWTSLIVPGTDSYAFLSSTAITTGLHNISLSISGTSGPGTFAVNFVPTPVPEPETYALMLAGLGAIGFVAARRKSS